MLVTGMGETYTFQVETQRRSTCPKGGVEPAVAMGGRDDGGEIFPRPRVVQARVLQVVCHTLKALRHKQPHSNQFATDQSCLHAAQLPSCVMVLTCSIAAHLDVATSRLR